MKTSDIKGIIPPVITPMNNDPEQTVNHQALREQVERLEGGSRLACRQRVLAEKQRLLDEAFARAADALLKLPRPEYIDLLASLAAENGQGGEALVFSAADRDTVGQAVVDCICMPMKFCTERT